MKRIFILFFVAPFMSNGQAFLHNPVEGTQGKDYVIVNYVDWSFDSIQDHRCGSKTYDGHQGTDFVLRSFRQMDSGVYILAAANGRVTYAMDTFFDREKESVISKQFGNYLCIRHPNKYYSYYAHIKKNSLLVQAGDSVIAGQRIAQIASSGNSTDPHLHFELWYDSSFVVDPFKGLCGNPNSLWLEEPAYDTSFSVWEHGLHLDTLNINKIRERDFYFPSDTSINMLMEHYVSAWGLFRGVKKGDSITAKWFTKLDGLIEQNSFYVDRDYWYYYFWTHIKTPYLPYHKYYSVIIERNGSQIIKDSFNTYVENLPSINMENPCSKLLKKKQGIDFNNVKLYNYKGQNISHWLQPNNDLKFLPKGMYFIEIRDEKNGVCVEKIGID